jgi:hypothetical protein
MSYIDNLLKLSDSQALSATADSTNVIDLSSDRDVGKGEAMALVINVVVAADVASGNETYEFQLESDSTAGMSSSTIVAGGTVDKALLIAGSTFAFPIGTINEQFLQGVFTLGGTTPSVTIDAWVSPLSSVDQYVSYADNVTIG